MESFFLIIGFIRLDFLGKVFVVNFSNLTFSPYKLSYIFGFSIFYVTTFNL